MMSRNGLLYVLIVVMLLSVACDRRPPGVPDKRAMADLLFDVHVAESSVSLSQWKNSAGHKEKFYASVFEKYGMTEEDFNRSVEWYSLHPEKYVEVYDMVVNRLDTLEKDLEAYVYHPDERPTRQDSIDTIDIWDKRPYVIYPREGKRRFNEEELKFYCQNIFLECGDHYKLSLLMRTYAKDTVPRSMFFAVQKNDSVADTLSCEIKTDSVLRRYSLMVRMPEDECAMSLRVMLMDSVQRVETMEIDSIHLYRVYNFYEHRLSSSYKRSLIEMRDSAVRAVPLKKKN